MTDAQRYFYKYIKKPKSLKKNKIKSKALVVIAKRFPKKTDKG